MPSPGQLLLPPWVAFAGLKRLGPLWQAGLTAAVSLPQCTGLSKLRPWGLTLPTRLMAQVKQ